jgi:hypothetical protein
VFEGNIFHIKYISHAIKIFENIWSLSNNNILKSEKRSSFYKILRRKKPSRSPYVPKILFVDSVDFLNFEKYKKYKYYLISKILFVNILKLHWPHFMQETVFQKFKMAATQYRPFREVSLFLTSLNCQFSIKSFVQQLFRSGK